MSKTFLEIFPHFRSLAEDFAAAYVRDTPALAPFVKAFLDTFSTSEHVETGWDGGAYSYISHPITKTVPEDLQDQWGEFLAEFLMEVENQW